MKKILITGATGFVGNYLIDRLTDEQCELHGTTLTGNIYNDERLELHYLDLTDNYSVNELIKKIKPDEIYHLASQSSVRLSWDKPQLTTEINIIGTINILEAIRLNNLKTKILLIGSSEEYGSCFKTESSPGEDSKCMPENIYAISKFTQNLIGKMYNKAYDMNIMMTRSFNHIGPGQSPQFVISDFSKQIAEIILGEKNPIMYVGNIEAARDFLDVRDVVNAYVAIMNNGKKGEIYNVGSGESLKISDILKKIIETSGLDIKVEIDKNKFRSIDIAETKADITKLVEDTGWKKKYDINETIDNMLEFWINEKKINKKKRF